ncbi:MAG: hypothetical protein JW862_01720, partial [Anaerolineales bacterium]|nr:hypothetical protein [Anaerolineales bacterium]
MKKNALFVTATMLLVTLFGWVTDAQAMSGFAKYLNKEIVPGDLSASTGVVKVDAAAQGGGGINSLSGSFVVFDPSVGGSAFFTPGASQTFCFRAESFTNDWEYVNNLWMHFPTDWTVSNVSVAGTPTCDSGAPWDAFSWGYETAPYEIVVNHNRYQEPTDHCTAYYCFDVISGSGAPDAPESWYWDGDGYGGPPHHPCSSDGYTPASMAVEPCDEAVNPQASIPPLWQKLINGIPWTPSISVTVQTSDTIMIEEIVDAGGLGSILIEDWDPDHLQLVSFAHSPDTVVTVDPATGFMEWIIPPGVVGPQTLTKWFHVEPCTWT